MEKQEQLLVWIDEKLEEIRDKVASPSANFDRTEDEGYKGILDHFNRIHDKLFSFNNILIAGFFALIQLNTNLSHWIILFPIINLGVLVVIEWIMMETSRSKANIKNIPLNEINLTFSKWNNRSTNASLFAIVSTLVVIIFFIFYLMK